MSARYARGGSVLVLACVLALARAVTHADPLTITPSVTLSESVTDNVRFDESDEWDSITRLRLRLGFVYRTQYAVTTFGLGTSAVYVARDERTTVDLGEAQRLTIASFYDYSPRLRFTINDSFGRVGSNVRDLDFATNPFPRGDNPNQNPNQPPVDEDPSGNNPSNVNLILPGESAFTNSFGVSATYLTAPDWNLGVRYTNGFSYFSGRDDDDDDAPPAPTPSPGPGPTQTPNDSNGDGESIDVSQGVALNVGHQYSPQLSLNGRLGYNYFYYNDALDSDSYSLTAGPSYDFTNLWHASALVGGGISRTIKTGSIRATADVSLDVTRVLEDSLASAGARNGFTPSGGVGGTSQTTTAYIAYSRRLTDFLSGDTSFSYSHFDTNSSTFDLLTLRVGLFFPIWQDINGSINYAYRRRYANVSDDPADDIDDDFQDGVVDGNAVSLQITWSSPLWQLDL